MNKLLFRFLVCAGLLLIVCVPFRSAGAKGAPGRVVISGPGLETPVEITDPAALQSYSFFAFENVEQRLEAPANPGQGYQITRFILDGEKTLEWDRLVYYPQPSGQRGIVFYEGLRQPSMSTEFDGYWYAVSPEGEAAMRQVLAEVPGGRPEASGAEPIDRRWVLGGLAAGVVAAFLAAAAFRRRALAGV